MMNLVTLPLEMVTSEIASHLDSSGLACLSATCKNFKNLSNRAKRLAFREEVLRCAAILREIYDSLEEQAYIMKNDDRCMMRTVLFLFDRKLDELYRFVDPEIYDDMTMYGCPPDIPLVWNFFKKVCDMGLG